MITTQSHSYGVPAAPIAKRTHETESQPGDYSLFCHNSMSDFGAAQTVFCEGDENSAVYEVIEGVLKIYKLTFDGRLQIVGFAFPGQLLGLEPGDDYTTTAETITKVKLCRYPRQSFQRTIDENPVVAKRLLAMVARELASAQSRMLLLGRKTAIERVASFLVWLSRINADRGANPSEIELPMRRADIGDYLGLTTETTSRIFSRLREMGHIDLDHHHLVSLRDIDELNELAEGETGPFG